MRLWLLRHGEAAAWAARDELRPLTALGIQQVTDAAVLLRGQPLASVQVSPYLRAQQSAALVAQSLASVAPLITVPWLQPEILPSLALRHIAALPEGDHLLVAHQPLLGGLLSLLRDGDLQYPYAFRLAELAELQGDFPLAGSMQLLQLHSPAG